MAQCEICKNTIPSLHLFRVGVDDICEQCYYPTYKNHLGKVERELTRKSIDSTVFDVPPY